MYRIRKAKGIKIVEIGETYVVHARKISKSNGWSCSTSTIDYRFKGKLIEGIPNGIDTNLKFRVIEMYGRTFIRPEERYIGLQLHEIISIHGGGIEDLI